MGKSTFYLVIFVLVVTDVLSNKYQKRLWAQREAELVATDSSKAGLAAVDKHMGH